MSAVRTETIPTKDAWGRTTATGVEIDFVARDDRGWYSVGYDRDGHRESSRGDTIEVQVPTVTVTLPLDVAQDFLSLDISPVGMTTLQVRSAISKALPEQGGASDG